MNNKTKQRILLLACIAIISIVFVNHWLSKAYQEEVVLNQKTTVDIYRNTLEAALARFDYLPHVLSQNTKLFEQAFNQTDLANKSLQEFTESSKVDVIYIMDEYGETIASSNWNQENSFVGSIYGYRPYFKQALKQQKGQFFGVGATTNIPGYFVSAPYRVDNKVKAVIVVKVLLSSIVDSWDTRTKDDEIVFVSDENEVIILSSYEKWLYQALKQLSKEQNQTIKEQKQFGNNVIKLLGINKKNNNKELVEIDKDQFIESTISTSVMNWKIHYLVPYGQINTKLIAFWSKVLIFLLIGLATVLIIRGVNNRIALRRSQVESRSLRKLNLTLETEIEERKQIENKLRKAQVELRRTSKLTAMGQLSASITHEIGQPLAAMHTYIANIKMSQQQLVDDSESDESTAKNSISTLNKLDQLVSRITSITQQLRYFARSGDREIQPLDLSKAISGAITTTLPSLEEAGIKFELEQNKESLIVEAGRVRLEQVIVNLIKNAMEAIVESSTGNHSSIDKETSINNKNKQEKWIKLSLESDENNAIIIIDDSGPGVPEDIRKELFEPFITTKASGVGMGLGLAISLNIVYEMKGTLHVENRSSEGARFTVTLPLLNND